MLILYNRQFISVQSIPLCTFCQRNYFKRLSIYSNKMRIKAKNNSTVYKAFDNKLYLILQADYFVNSGCVTL